MTTKLTLNVDVSVIEKAKTYAKKTNRSLSKIIESYLSDLTNEIPDCMESKINRIAGKINLPDDFNEESLLREALEQKHL